MTDQEYDLMHKAVCKAAKELGDNSSAIKEWWVNTLYNFKTNDRTGWAPTFRLSNKYHYDSGSFEQISQMFCSTVWQVRVVRGAMEISIHITYADAEKLLSKTKDK